MKQILIIYFVILSRCHSCKRPSTRTQETVKVEATLSAPVSLSRSHAGSTERARRQFGVGELNHGKVCATRARLHWTGFRAVRGARTPPAEIGQKKKTYWTGLRAAVLAASLSIRGIYTPSVRTKLQTNCTCRSAVCNSSTQFHQQIYVIQTIRRDSRRMILELFQSHLEQHFEFSSLISTCLFLIIAVKSL